MELTGSHVAVLVENNYQELEVWYPIFRFRESGAKVTIIGTGADRYLSKLGYPVEPDIAAGAADPRAYDAVIIPGGYAPDLLRLSKPVVDLVRAAHGNDKVVAAICHGSWLLASARILEGRNVTGAPSIRDDLENAGGVYLDQEVVCDGNIITSRKPSDLPAFTREIVRAVEHKEKTNRGAV